MEAHPDGACFRVRVPAKVNLFLAVRGRRCDGFHEVVTVLQTVSLFDHLRVGLYGPPGRGHHPAGRRQMRVELLHDENAGLPPEAENLAVRAAHVLAAHTRVFDPTGDPGRDGPRTVIDLGKGIPIAGGMAGGSADAAGALVALNRLWGCELSREQLREVAANLGSDVPFCVVGGTALASGRGESLAQVLCRGTFHWVIGTSAEPLSTAEVYRAWDRTCRPTPVEPDAVLAALRGEDPVALGAALHNELEPAAFALRPELAERKQRLLEAGALGAMLSGSGPTLLALAEDEDAARSIAQRVLPLFARTVTARSPAGGPELQQC